jgi:site-specific DNA recombinase
MYLIYTRRSTDDPENQKNSLEYQERMCRDYAVKHKLQLATDKKEEVVVNGVIKERHSAFTSKKLNVSEAGLVAYQIERPKFMRMISWLLDGTYEGVIVLCWDRISRSEQSDLIVKELLKEHGICIRFVQVEYNVHTSAGELHMDIDGMFARHWSRVTSEKVRDTFKKLRKDKRYPHNAPIGYIDSGSDNKPFDHERAPIIKRLFELYDTGEWSLNELTRWAEKQGLKTKPRRRNRSHSEIMRGVELEHNEQNSIPLCKSSIQRILRSRFYIGEMIHKGAWLQGGHSPLIDCALFERVQKRLRQNCKTIHYMDKPFFSYRDLFRCTCGRGYTPYRKKGHIYYMSKCKDDCPNKKMNVREDMLVEAIQTIFDQIYFTEDELRDIQAQAHRGIERVSAMRDKEIDDLNARRKRVLNDMDYLKANKITLLRENTMAPAELNSELERLVAELEEVDALLSAQTESEKEMLTYILTFSELFKNASALYKDATDMEKRQLAHLVFSELRFINGEMASYSAKEEFSILLNRPRVANGGPDGTRTRDLHSDSVAL